MSRWQQLGASHLCKVETRVDLKQILEDKRIRRTGVTSINVYFKFPFTEIVFKPCICVFGKAYIFHFL